jgi:hypothetical protein
MAGGASKLELQMTVVKVAAAAGTVIALAVRGGSRRLTI